MKKTLTFILAAMVLAGNAYALPLLINGDFSQGSTGWASSGNVLFQNGRAELGTTTSTVDSSLSQSFYITPGTAALSVAFDYIFAGSDSSWLSSDSFEADLTRLLTFELFGIEIFDYTVTTELVNDSSNNDLSNTIVHFATTISPLGNVSDANPNGRISFMLDEARGLLGDGTNTWVGIDNVSIDDGRPGAAPVPEPATLMLLGSGLLGLAGFRKKVKK